jgi:uncharacterized protein (DUF1015 family)
VNSELIESQPPKLIRERKMQLKPFQAFRFNPEVVGDVTACIAPPYDVINIDQQEQLYQKSKYNIVRIIKGQTNPSDNDDDNQYSRAAGYLADWIERGALKQDTEESIYGYVQDFKANGTQFQRYSFIALAKLEEFGKVVKPHEEILKKPLIDRLNLKKSTSADFGLVFMLYEDRQRIADNIITEAAKEEPLIDFVDEQGVRHRLFAITTQEDIEQIVNMMSDKSCIIADGHHRYTTGLTYSRENGNPAAKFQMIAFANTYHEGLIILATHRLVGNLDNFNSEAFINSLRDNFRISEYKFNSAETKSRARQKMLAEMITEHEKDNNAIGIYSSTNAFYVAVLKDKHQMDNVASDMSTHSKLLDLTVLHKLILEGLLGIDKENLARGENIQYVKDTPSAIDDSIAQVDTGQKQVAFFMNPVKIKELKAVTDAGERMPQKATYFYPKVYSGLTIYKF